MGLIGGLARVAAVSAVAEGTREAVGRRNAQKNVNAYGGAEQQYSQQQAPQPEYEEPAPAPAPAPAGDDLTGKLQQLADLHTQGVLTDEEFAEAKAKLLGS